MPPDWPGFKREYKNHFKFLYLEFFQELDMLSRGNFIEEVCCTEELRNGAVGGRRTEVKERILKMFEITAYY